MQRLATICVQCGEYERAQAPLRRQLELEPWQEEAHRLLMWLLAASGQRSAALAQYRTCCRRLARELDAEPSAATRELHRRIKDGSLGEPPSLWSSISH
jgi:DNA-binding SARP family transcriptional activator